MGGVLSFGEGDDAPAITVTMRDVRCSMVNLDPDSAQSCARSAEGGRSCEPEHRGSLRHGHSHRSTGGRTDRTLADYFTTFSVTSILVTSPLILSVAAVNCAD